MFMVISLFWAYPMKAIMVNKKGNILRFILIVLWYRCS
jgi:hypothetical protein